MAPCQSGLPARAESLIRVPRRPFSRVEGLQEDDSVWGMESRSGQSVELARGIRMSTASGATILAKWSGWEPAMKVTASDRGIASSIAGVDLAPAHGEGWVRVIKAAHVKVE